MSDRTGDALPQVSVTASSPALAEPRTTTTDSEGRFAFEDLPAADYSLVFQLGGFATLSQDGITVVDADDTVLDVRLSLASLSEEVTVVGSKLETGRQEFGASVGYFSQERIESEPIVTVEDAFHRTANAFAGATEFGAFSIRGVNNNGLDFAFSSATSLASILVNQTAVGPRTGDYLNPSLFDAESVEILRGPQSTLQGPNALIGSVLINYNKASFDGYEGRARLEGGDLDTRRVQVMQNVELIDDVLSARVTYEDRYSRGAASNPVTGEDDVQRTGVQTSRLQLALRPRSDDSVRFDLTWLRNESESNPYAFVVANEAAGITLEDRQQPWNRPDGYPSDVNFLSLETHVDIGDRWAIDAVTGYSELDGLQLFDADLSPFDFLNVDAWFTDEILSQEVRASYRGGKVDGLVGVFHSQAEFGYGFQGQGIFPDGMGGVVPFNQQTRILEEVDQTDIFGRVEWDASDRWRLTGGLRLTNDTRSSDNAADNNGFVSALSAEEDFDQLLPSASAQVSLTDNTSIGASWARGFKAGGLAFGLFLGLAEPFGEEYTDNYELFLRHRSADGRLVLNANAFTIDWSDQQIPYTPPGGFPGFDSLVRNAGRSKLDGLELELEYYANEALNLFASFGITNTEYVEFVLDGVDFAGESFPQSPGWNGSLGFNWRSPGGWFAGGTLSYTDSAYSDLASPVLTQVSARSLLDARFGYRRAAWSLYAWGKNLLDDQYPVTQLDGRPFGLPGAYARMGDPITVGVGIDLNW